MATELNPRDLTTRSGSSCAPAQRCLAPVKISFLVAALFVVLGLYQERLNFRLASSSHQVYNQRETHLRLLQGAPEVHLDAARDYRGAFATKTEKIIFCAIAKVGSSEWLKVLRWIDGQADWEVPDHSGHGLRTLKDMGIDEANQLLNDPTWFRFAVVREPAERLLSCFREKCNQWNMKAGYQNCPYLELWPEIFRERLGDDVPRVPNEETNEIMSQVYRDEGRMQIFPQYVQAITRRVLESPCTENPHWIPQWCQCSLDVTYPHFEVVRWRNMSAEVVEGILSVASSPERGREMAAFVQKRMRTNHDDKGKKTGAGELVKTAYSEEMLEAVREAYAKDYELFSAYWE